MVAKDSNEYSIKLIGPGHTLEKPVSENLANQIINLVMLGKTGVAVFPEQLRPNGAQVETAKMAPKQFLAQKKPKNNNERVACLAYYLTHNRNTSSFKTKDIRKLNIDAAQPRFSNPASSVTAATSTHRYLSSAGGGNKQITALGEAVVEALPDREKVSAAIAEHQPTRQRTKKRKKSK
jgi:hypothetical protein